MWFPMIVGSDEKRFAWMDEGLTQFDQSQSMDAFFKGFDDEARNRKNYLDFAATGGEVELMHHGDRFPNYPAYGVGAYYKPATAMVALRGVLGRDLFDKAFKEYGRRWQYRHPSPYDFFATFEDVSGQDLSWFWRTWFFETWRLDQRSTPSPPWATTRSRSGSRTGASADAGPPGGHPAEGPATAWTSPWTSGSAGPSGPRSGSRRRRR